MKLNLGCDRNKLPGYVNVDIREEVRPDMVLDLREFPYPWSDSSIDEIFIENTLEHISYTKHDRIFQEFYRILRPKGRLIIVTPDIEDLLDRYLIGRSGKDQWKFVHFLFGGHEHEHDYHRAVYTVKRMKWILEKHGFRVVEIEPGLRVEAVK